MGQSSYCSCQGPEFGSQHPRWAAHNSLNLQLQMISSYPALQTSRLVCTFPHVYTGLKCFQIKSLVFPPRKNKFPRHHTKMFLHFLNSLLQLLHALSSLPGVSFALHFKPLLILQDSNYAASDPQSLLGGRCSP